MRSIKHSVNSFLARVKWINVLMLGVVLSGIFDAFTFYWYGHFEYETNILVSMFGLSAAGLILFKGIVLAMFVWHCTKAVRYHVIVQYILMFMTLFVIVGQGYGGYLNLRTHHVITTSSPGEVQPLSVEQSSAFYINIIIVIYVIPMTMGTVAFWLWWLVFADKQLKTLKGVKNKCLTLKM